MKPRLVIIGYGNVAAHHLNAFQSLGCDVVASCNRSEAGRSKALEAGIPTVYADWQSMLDEEKPDGVICCASYWNIYETALELIPRGIPLLLEKPPGLSFEEAEELQRCAEQHTCPVFVGMNRRHYSVFGQAMAEAQNEGPVTSALVEWSEAPSFFLDRGDPPEAVDRLAFANSLHGLDLLTWIAGPLRSFSVNGQGGQSLPHRRMALHGLGDNNAVAAFHATWDSPGPWRVSFTVPGRRYVFAPLESCHVYAGASRTPRIIQPEADDLDGKPGFLAQARAFLQLLAAPTVHHEHNIASVLPAMQLAEALTASCRSEKPKDYP